jgi:hypothetical protein
MPEVMRDLTKDCTYQFSRIWKGLVDQQTNAHQINEIFVRQFSANLPGMVERSKHYHIYKSYVQFAANVMYNIKLNKDNLGEGRVQAIFLCQLDVNELIMLYLSTLLRGDMATCEGLFWGDPFTRDFTDTIMKNSTKPNDFSSLDNHKISEAVKKLRVGYRDEL